MELEKAKTHVVAKVIEYEPNKIVSTTILKKITGNIIITSVALGEELLKKISPFDTFLQIVDGTADLTLGDDFFLMKSGDCIIVPAHAPHSIKANQQFKMITTIIKSGYEI